jgi:anti-anti-sigma regulatory factor
MILTTGLFKNPGQVKENLCISGFTRLTGAEANHIRSEMAQCLSADVDTVYVNAKEVTDADLSGINEIIHTNYTLQQTGKELVFVYRSNSVIEKWIATTGLDKFVQTAILPA